MSFRNVPRRTTLQIVLLLVWSFSVPTSAINEDFVVFNGTLGLWCDRQRMTFAASSARCQSLIALPSLVIPVPGALVKVTSQPLDALVLSLVGFGGRIGVIERTQGNWVYDDNTPISFSNWLPGEPNNFLGWEKYGEYYRTFLGNVGWNDVADSSAPFVCQFPGIDVACEAYCNRHATSTAWNSMSSCGCTCSMSFDGSRCDRCAVGRFGYPACNRCSLATDCDAAATANVSSDGYQCTCQCKPGAAGPRCETCLPNHAHWPACRLCSIPGDCNGHATSATGNGTACTCACLKNYAGQSCDRCSRRFARYPRCVTVTASVSVRSMTVSHSTSPTALSRSVTANQTVTGGSSIATATISLTRPTRSRSDSDSASTTRGSVTWPSKSSSRTRGSFSPTGSSTSTASVSVPSRSTSPNSLTRGGGTLTASITPEIPDGSSTPVSRTVSQITSLALASTWATSPASLTSGLRASSLTHSSSCDDDVVDPPSILYHPVGFPIGFRLEECVGGVATASATTLPNEMLCGTAVSLPIQFIGGCQDVRCALNFHRGAVVWQFFVVLPVVVGCVCGIWIVLAVRKRSAERWLDELRCVPRSLAMSRLPSTVATAMVFVSNGVTESGMLLLCVGLGMYPSSIAEQASVAAGDISLLVLIAAAYVTLVAMSLWYLTGPRLLSTTVELTPESRELSCLPRCVTLAMTGGVKWSPRVDEVASSQHRHSVSAHAMAFHRSFKALFDDLRAGCTWFHAWDVASCVACNVVAGVRSTSPTVCLSCKYALSAIFAVHLLLVSIARPYTGLVTQVQAVLVSALALVASLLLSFGGPSDGAVADWVVVVAMLLPLVRLPVDAAVFVANQCGGCKRLVTRPPVSPPPPCRRPLDDDWPLSQEEMNATNVVPLLAKRSVLGNLDRQVQDDGEEQNEARNKDGTNADKPTDASVNTAQALRAAPVPLIDVGVAAWLQRTSMPLLPTRTSHGISTSLAATSSDADDPFFAVMRSEESSRPNTLVQPLRRRGASLFSLPKPPSLHLTTVPESVECSIFLDDLLGQAEEAPRTSQPAPRLSRLAL